MWNWDLALTYRALDSGETVGKGRFELPTSRSRTAHSNLAELLPGAGPDDTTRFSGLRDRLQGPGSTRILRQSRGATAPRSPGMGRITIDMTINAPVTTVFAYVDDYRNTTKYMKDLVKWQPTGKVTHGKGAKFGVGMKAGPTTLTSVVDITTWSENKAIGWH